MGKMMEQGPVLIVTFHAQLVMVIKNPKGEVVEGDPVSEGGCWMGQVAILRPVGWQWPATLHEWQFRAIGSVTWKGQQGGRQKVTDLSSFTKS